MPKKTDMEKMFGPKSAADTVKKKINDIKKLSDTLTKLAINLTISTKTVGRLGTRVLIINSSGLSPNFTCDINLADTGSFSKEDKLMIMDKITELINEYQSREAAATYEEIQRLGKEL